MEVYCKRRGVILFGTQAIHNEGVKGIFPFLTQVTHGVLLHDVFSLINRTGSSKQSYNKYNIYIYMGVSKNRGTPKWMVYNGKPYSNG